MYSQAGTHFLCQALQDLSKIGGLAETKSDFGALFSDVNKLLWHNCSQSSLERKAS